MKGDVFLVNQKMKIARIESQESQEQLAEIGVVRTEDKCNLVR